MQGRRTAKLSWLAVLLVVGLVCAFSILFAYAFTRARGTDSYEAERLAGVNYVQDAQVTGSNVVYYDGATIGCVSVNGKTRWTYLVGPGVTFCAGEGAVASWNSDALTLIDAKDGVTVYSGSMGDTILSAKSGSSYTAVQLGEQRRSSIVLLNEDGRRVDTLSFEDVLVVDYGFFSGGSLFWVMTLDPTGTVPTCNIGTYRPGKTYVGNIDDIDQVVYRVMFQSSSIITVGENYMKVYDYTGAEDPSLRRLVYGWYLAAYDETDSDLMAFSLISQHETGVSDLWMYSQSCDQKLRFPFPAASMFIEDGKVYGFSAEGYAMIATPGSNNVDTFALPVAGTVYGVMEGGVAVLGVGDGLYLVDLPG